MQIVSCVLFFQQCLIERCASATCAYIGPMPCMLLIKLMLRTGAHPLGMITHQTTGPNLAFSRCASDAAKQLLNAAAGYRYAWAPTQQSLFWDWPSLRRHDDLVSTAACKIKNGHSGVGLLSSYQHNSHATLEWKTVLILHFKSSWAEWVFCLCFDLWNCYCH